MTSTNVCKYNIFNPSEWPHIESTANKMFSTPRMFLEHAPFRIVFEPPPSHDWWQPTWRSDRKPQQAYSGDRLCRWCHRYPQVPSRSSHCTGSITLLRSRISGEMEHQEICSCGTGSVEHHSKRDGNTIQWRNENPGCRMAKNPPISDQKLGDSDRQNQNTCSGAWSILQKPKPRPENSLRTQFPAGKGMVHAPTPPHPLETAYGNWTWRYPGVFGEATSFESHCPHSAKRKKHGDWSLIHVAAKCRALLLYRLQPQGQKSGSITEKWLKKWNITQLPRTHPIETKFRRSWSICVY